MTELIFIIDPLSTLHKQKDSSLTIIAAANQHGLKTSCLTAADLFIHNGIAYARTTGITVDDDNNFVCDANKQTVPLSAEHIIFMRVDPPVDINYLNATHILDRAVTAGARVINPPQALRDFNEKVFATHFPDIAPPHIISSHLQTLYDFIIAVKQAVIKPLDAMGGHGVFRLDAGDVNIKSAIEMLSNGGHRLIMAQQYIPAITDGDKRILLINGNPIPYSLARIPAANDFRGNLAAGARYEARPLSKQDMTLCQRIAPTIQAHGLALVGLDVIGDYITEINITSPTCFREIHALTGYSAANTLIRYIMGLK